MLPYQNCELSAEERAEDLVRRMTIAEKARQMDMYSAEDVAHQIGTQPRLEVEPEKLAALCGDIGVGCIQIRNGDAKTTNQVQRYIIEHSRLGIPALFVEEGLHSFAVDGATIFPQQLCLASTFNPAIAERTGHAIAAEGAARGFHEIWAPVLDLARDIRWGRTEETYGEDAFLGGKMGAAFIRGAQGDDIKAADHLMCSPKHFSAYGGPVGGLNCMPAGYGKHEHEMYALPIFEEAFTKAHAMGTMCSYASVDGIPCAADRHLLTDTLRGKWKMPGYVRSDMCCISMLKYGHNVVAAPEEAVRLAINSGIDMQLYDFTHEFWQNTIISSVEDGSLSLDAVDTAVKRILKVKFLAGLFDKPYTDESLEEKTYYCAAHIETALDSAREGIVLLKNNGILPLNKGIKKLAVIGPLANAFYPGDYATMPSCRKPATFLDEIKKALPDTEIMYDEGCRVLDRDISPIPDWWTKTPDGERGLRAEYFSSSDFSGDPVLTRNDCGIDFNWIYYRPAPGLSAGFSVRWTGILRVPHTEAETFNIGVSGTDTMRLFLDGQLIAENSEKSNTALAPFTFEKGKEYTVKIEFINDGNGNRVLFGRSDIIRPFDRAVEMAKAADAVIAVVGDKSEVTSGENFDRCTLDLPGRQLELLKALYAAGKPIIEIMESGRPVSATWEDAHMDAILEAWACGEMGAKAITEIILGDTEPSGRLPISFPRTVGQIPVNYNRKAAGGKRYVEMDWKPLYPFGFGLSYTKFEYSGFEVNKQTFKIDESIDVSFTVTNTGDRVGYETCQVYIHDMYASTVRPVMELKGFKKLLLSPGESKKVSITLSPHELRTLTPDFNWVVEPGDFEIMVGSSSDNIIFSTTVTAVG